MILLERQIIYEESVSFVILLNQVLLENLPVLFIKYSPVAEPFLLEVEFPRINPVYLQIKLIDAFDAVLPICLQIVEFHKGWV